MQDNPLTDAERAALHERARSFYDGMFGAGTFGRIAASLAKPARNLDVAGTLHVPPVAHRPRFVDVRPASASLGPRAPRARVVFPKKRKGRR